MTAPSEVPDLPLAGQAPSWSGHQRADDPDAGVFAATASEMPDAGLEPLYLGRPDAELPTAKKTTIPQPRVSIRKLP